jgi:hypothetical protein
MTPLDAPDTTGAVLAPRGERVVLWRLHGALDDLECMAISTSYGYALSLELAGEPILLELQRTVADLTDKAGRLESWLLTQGWQARDGQS